MSYTAKQRSYVDQFRADYVRANDLPSRPARWTLGERQVYNKSLARFIAANPQIFDQPHILTAGRIVDRTNGALESRNLAEVLAVNTPLDLVGLGYVVDDGLDRVNRLNPLSDLNISGTMIMAGIAIIGAAWVIAYVASPKLPVKR